MLNYGVLVKDCKKNKKTALKDADHKQTSAHADT